MALKTIAPTALNIADHIQSGDLVTWGQAMSEPRALVQSYLEARHQIGRTNAFVGLQLTNSLGPEHCDAITPASYGALGTITSLHRAGKLRLIPCRYSQLPMMIASGRLRPDVVLVQISPPGPDGTHSLGWCNDILPAAIAHARVVLAEVNPTVPWVHMDQPLDESRITAAIHSDQPLPVLPVPAPGAIDQAIAGHLAPIIPEGATLQYGIGSIPSAILNALRGHRHLGLHSGLVTEDIIDLVASGAMTHARKPLLPGIGVGAVAIGGERLKRFITNNPEFWQCQTGFTHGAAPLAALDNLVAINSALEVDLRGQVNAEQIGSRYLGAIGGQPDFMHAATAAPHGLSVIALPATSASAERRKSRIVARLSGPQVTTPRCDVDMVVTEHGFADLRGLDVPARVRALLAIASPDWREPLAKSAYEDGLMG